MDLCECRKLVVFGGSFDPPHVAHVTQPRVVVEALGADAVVYVPAARAPLKQSRRPTAAATRLAMLRLALDGCDRTQILTDEIDRANGDEPSYTVDTLEGLRRRLGPSVRMRLLIGTDHLRQFDRWKLPQRVVELAEPVVMVKPPATREVSLAHLSPEARRTWERRMVDVDPIDVSSTQIRQRISEGGSIERMVAPAVEAYIRDHGLYRVS